MILTAPLRFTSEHLIRPEVSGIDVVSTLQHFAIITYAVRQEDLHRHLPPRFEPVCIEANQGGFPDLETAMVVLTHPLTGHYRRRDGALGSDAVWH
jgi:hypothetical protein